MEVGAALRPIRWQASSHRVLGRLGHCGLAPDLWELACRNAEPQRRGAKRPSITSSFLSHQDIPQEQPRLLFCIARDPSP